MDVTSYVLSAVLPGKGADTVHFVVEPFSFESTVVAPDVDTFPGYIIILKIADIARLVVPLKHANAMLLAILIDALEDGAVGPDFGAKPILLIIAPESNIFRTKSALKGAESVRSIVQPLAVVAVSIIMNKSALAICLVSLPHALILAAVLPHLHAAAFALPILVPLPDVNCIIIQFTRTFIDQVRIGYLSLCVFNDECAESCLRKLDRLIHIVGYLIYLNGTLASTKINISI